VFVCPDKVSEDKRATLTAYGAEVVVVPSTVPPEDPQSYYSVSDRLAAEIPGGYKPDQFSNQNGPLSHYESTGPEIWEDTEGRITHFIVGAGAGQVVVADPEGSIYAGGEAHPYDVEGVGEDYIPDTYDASIPDAFETVTDAESFAMARRLAREEGLLVGGSSGMAVVAALRVARTLPDDAVVVVLLPDSGRGYMGKVFSDEWMVERGHMTAEGADK
jgi:cystathionine beta-synthase